MRVAIAALLITIIGSTFDTAKADQYRWCAHYSGGRGGGGTNCYFVTYAQCQAAVSGVGGFCARSPYAYYDRAPRRNYR